MYPDQDTQDFYFFELSASGSIEIGLSNIPSGANYHLYLYNNELTLVGYSGNPGNADEYILVTGMPPGRYYIRVRRVTGLSPQPSLLYVAFR